MAEVKKFVLCSFLFATFSLANAQLTITITSIPTATPLNSDIYIAGSFNSWNPGQPAYKLTNNNDGTYSITISPNPATLEFKFTRGSWETVEGNSSGGYLPNRSYVYSGGVQFVDVSIAGWQDLSGTHTATANVQVLDQDFYMPQLDRNRRIWLYLPPDYATSIKNYPVIYMHDGQNLFDAFYSFAGEWKIDESMDDLFIHGDFGAIIVGIDNGGGERSNEYSPWVSLGFGGGDGEAYASFLVNTLKPYIDSTYRTLPGRDYTAIAGSSLGANISMYTAIEYQDVFSKVGIFSPAFWFSDSCYVHLHEKGITQELRIYFVAGQNESSTNIADMTAMYNALVQEGQDENEMFFLSEPDGAHSEWFWAREYPDVYEWLFDDTLLANHIVDDQYWKIYPNPVSNYITVLTAPDDLTYSIYALNGTSITSGKLSNSSINTSGLPTGAYILQLSNHLGQTVYISRFIRQ
jgi:predicted alpha/beta superfamily hydrolase